MPSRPVYVAITREGLSIAIGLALQDGGDVWCGANAISREEYQLHSGPPFSRFNYGLDRKDIQGLFRALETIEEHHPGQTVLIEGESPNPSFQPTVFGPG